MAEYAKNTNVDICRSKAEIESILLRYGADQYTSGYNLETMKAHIMFRYVKTIFKIEIEIPDPKNFDKTETGRLRSRSVQMKAWEQAHRQRWRALTLYIKATLEAIDSGIIKFEEAFIGYAVLPDGSTFKDWAQSELNVIYDSGKMPKQLPRF